MRMRMKMRMRIKIKMSMTLSSIYIEGIRTVFILYIFFMKDILNVKNTNKNTSSNFYPCNIHKQKHFK